MNIGSEYFALEGGRGEYSEKRSVFIGSAYGVTSEARAEEILAGLKRENPKARHIAFAYRLICGVERFSDDGEPQGTAGKPIAEILSAGEFCDTLIAVVRFFGGVKLGPGGLKRAYAAAASAAVSASNRTRFELCEAVRVKASYKDSDLIRKKLEKTLCRIVKTEYNDINSNLRCESVILEIIAPTGTNLKERLSSLTLGRAVTEVLPVRYVNA